MPPRLYVRKIAESQSLNLSRFQQKARLSMSTARRLWYSTSDGKDGGPRLRAVRLDVLEAAAQSLGVSIGDLFSPPASAGR
ncbi:MAG TPA: helix-turn-helix transcriptional regulator [Planctomycetaceae bacterium]|nr:helix-turn-helix transcriptional regulator [Planctomycetaceae bacterium]